MQFPQPRTVIKLDRISEECDGHCVRCLEVRVDYSVIELLRMCSLEHSRGLLLRIATAVFLKSLCLCGKIPQCLGAGRLHDRSINQDDATKIGGAKLLDVACSFPHRARPRDDDN